MSGDGAFAVFILAVVVGWGLHAVNKTLQRIAYVLEANRTDREDPYED